VVRVAGSAAGTWFVGQKVKCPVCGREGVAAYSILRRGEREYRYRVVVHEGGTKCVVGRELGDGRVVPVKRRGSEGKRLPLDAFAKKEGAGGGSSVPALDVDPVELDKALWYSHKVSASWGSLRQAVEQETVEFCLAEFKRVVAETALRRGVDGTKLVELAEEFVNASGDGERAKVKNKLNLAVKEFCKGVVLKALGAK
jgi:hypothetical protein